MLSIMLFGYRLGRGGHDAFGSLHCGRTLLWGDESQDRVREIKEGVWPAGAGAGRGERKKERAVVAAACGGREHGTGNINWFCLNRIMREGRERPRDRIVNWRLDERTDLAPFSSTPPPPPPGMKWSVRIRRTFEKLPKRIELRSCLHCAHGGSSERAEAAKLAFSFSIRDSDEAFSVSRFSR